MKKIEGICEKVFAIINTTEYNNDGRYAINLVNESELSDMGFTLGANSEVVIGTRIVPIRNIGIGECALTDETGCILVRVA